MLKLQCHGHVSKVGILCDDRQSSLGPALSCGWASQSQLFNAMPPSDARRGDLECCVSLNKLSLFLSLLRSGCVTLIEFDVTIMTAAMQVLLYSLAWTRVAD
jgi:hypothetical protein